MRLFIYIIFFLSFLQAMAQPLPLVTPATCSENNGKIQLFPSADDLSIYTLTWHEGDENGPVLPASPDNPALLENLVPGTYTVVVTQTATGCTAVESYEVGG